MALVHCRECGKKISETAISCPICGASQKGKSGSSEKTKTIAALFAFFLGMFGGQWWYLNRQGRAATYLICGTIGWLLIIPALVIIVMNIIDFIRFLSMSEEKFNAEYC